MNNTKYWIALEQSEGIGPANLSEISSRIIESGLSVIDMFDLTENEIIEEFNFTEKLASSIEHARKLLPEIEKDYFSLLDAGIDVIPFFDSRYPLRLREIMGNSIPPILYTYGNIEILGMKGAAVLGDKYVSDKGALISYMAAKDLCRHKLSVISGFAAGADMIAHRSAMENSGFTLAVLPCGILNFRSPESMSGIIDPDRFLMLSPFYPSREINTFNAYIRNKIACVLSRAVYIIEAPEDGGIFEAAKSANKYRIPLFTTEYSQYPENAKGNKKIIEELGGTPVRGRLENNMTVPNMDRIIGAVKFD